MNGNRGQASTEGSPARVLLVITTTGFGGAERCLELLATGIDRTRFEPLLCSLCPPGVSAERIAAASVEVRTLGMSSRPSLLQLVRGIFRLRSLIDDQQVDLVHTALYRANLIGLLAARLSRRRPRVVASQHSLNPDWMPLATRLVRVTRPWADRLITVSRPVLEEVLRTESIAEDRVVLIENGVDTEAYRPDSDRALRQRLDPEGTSLLIGAMGRLVPSKGLATLIEAAARVSDGRPPVRLVLAGDGPERPALEALVDRLGLRGRVQFLGFWEDVRSFYHAIDVIALSSRTEGTPYSLLEAMACGLPVIATRVGGLPEILGEGGEAGLLVPSEDPASFAEAIARLRSEPALRDRMGARARERVLERYDARTMRRRYEQVFAETLAAR